MRRLGKASVFALAMIASVVVSTAALADGTGYTETGNTTTGDQNVVFKDDPLAAGGFGPKDARITVVPSPKRVMLLRPRTQFVQEMLKSVEAL
jgi:hypothetical protein